MHIVELSKSFHFEGAHHLPAVPKDHKCRGLHGHSYEVVVTVRGAVDPQSGWLMDFADIKAAMQPLSKLLDHKNLNLVEGLPNPTAEMLAVWLWQRLAPTLPGLHEIEIRETTHSRCRYRGEQTE